MVQFGSGHATNFVGLWNMKEILYSRSLKSIARWNGCDLSGTFTDDENLIVLFESP